MTRVLTFVAIVAILLGGYLFASTLAHALWYAPDNTTPVVAVAPTTPTRLIIPSVGVDANVQQVGIAKSGSMAVPSNYTDVAWYRLGAVPGQLGSAVIDGHVDNGFGLPGVFKDLANIKKGDDVYVQEKDGTKLHFVVTDIEVYPYDGAPTQKIFAQNDRARLNIITCKGEWVPNNKTYDHRLVVYTELRG